LAPSQPFRDNPVFQALGDSTRLDSKKLEMDLGIKRMRLRADPRVAGFGGMRVAIVSFSRKEDR
jgi:hypothetical protein